MELIDKYKPCIYHLLYGTLNENSGYGIRKIVKYLNKLNNQIPIQSIIIINNNNRHFKYKDINIIFDSEFQPWVIY